MREPSNGFRKPRRSKRNIFVHVVLYRIEFEWIERERNACSTTTLLLFVCVRLFRGLTRRERYSVEFQSVPKCWKVLLMVTQERFRQRSMLQLKKLMERIITLIFGRAHSLLLGILPVFRRRIISRSSLPRHIDLYVKAPEINKKLFSQNSKFPIKIEKKLLFSIRMFDVYSLNFLGPWKTLCDLLRVRISKFS